MMVVRVEISAVVCWEHCLGGFRRRGSEGRSGRHGGRVVVGRNFFHSLHAVFIHGTVRVADSEMGDQIMQSKLASCGIRKACFPKLFLFSFLL